MGWEQALKPIAFGLFYYAVKRVVKMLTSRYVKGAKEENGARKPVGGAVEKEGKKGLEESAAGKKGVSKAKEKKAARKAEQAALAAGVEKKKGDTAKALLMCAACLAACGCATGYCYWKYGPLFFVGGRSKMLSLSAVEWQELLKRRRVCFVGGHHRSGTTAIWRALATHPRVAWFGEQRESGLDFSEGAFAQDVYPRFGVGLELNVQTLMGANKGGLGKYALEMPASELVWTEDRANSDVQARLLNSFGFYWDRRPPGVEGASVLLEKSPPNVVIARFLQAVVDYSDSTPRRATEAETRLADDDFFDLSAALKPADSRAAFVFVTRHPLAVSLSLYDFGAKHGLPELVAHWVALETYARANSARLAHVRRVKLEDFAANPVETLLDLWAFLGQTPDRDLALAAAAAVRPDPNRHHVDKYCDKLLTQPRAQRQHAAVVDAFERDVAQFGYLISDFCDDHPAFAPRDSPLPDHSDEHRDSDEL